VENFHLQGRSPCVVVKHRGQDPGSSESVPAADLPNSFTLPLAHPPPFPSPFTPVLAVCGNSLMGKSGMRGLFRVYPPPFPENAKLTQHCIKSPLTPALFSPPPFCRLDIHRLESVFFTPAHRWRTGKRQFAFFFAPCGREISPPFLDRRKTHSA